MATLGDKETQEFVLESSRWRWALFLCVDSVYSTLSTHLLCLNAVLTYNPLVSRDEYLASILFRGFICLSLASSHPKHLYILNALPINFGCLCWVWLSVVRGKRQYKKTDPHRAEFEFDLFEFISMGLGVVVLIKQEHLRVCDCFVHAACSSLFASIMQPLSLNLWGIVLIMLLGC